MKKITIKFALCLIMLSMVGFSSCLKKDLPALPLWETNNIDHVYVEYRYNSGETYYDEPIVAYQKLITSGMIVDSANSIIHFAITVPSPAGTFTAEERDKVRQDSLWVYMDLSTGATVAPVGNTPKPGNVTDLTKPQVYEVMAANGETREWTIMVTNFSK